VGQFCNIMPCQIIKHLCNNKDAMQPGNLTVRNDVGNAVLVSVVRFAFVEKNGSRAICHQTPVLHSSHGLRPTLSQPGVI
jgi:hypothetical protein